MKQGVLYSFVLEFEVKICKDIKILQNPHLANKMKRPGEVYSDTSGKFRRCLGGSGTTRHI